MVRFSTPVSITSTHFETFKRRHSMKSRKILISVVVLALLVSVVAVLSASAAPSAAPPAPKAKFSTAVAFNRQDACPSATWREAQRHTQHKKRGLGRRATRHPTRRSPVAAKNSGFSGDGAIQGAGALRAAAPNAAATIPGTIANFEGISNQDNFNLFGFRVNPPDPNGDVGPNHYVEMVNLAFAVYDKPGNLLMARCTVTCGRLRS